MIETRTAPQVAPMKPLAAVASVALVLAACAADAPSASPNEAAPTDTPPLATAAATPSPSADAEPSPDASTSPTPVADALLAVELIDVRTGEAFTLGALAAAEGPVLLEPMAIWCSSCRAQQREVVRAHETGTFASVSLDVDLSELPEDLADYAEREGFDWHFAMADAELYRYLQERFTQVVTHPPSTPLIVIEPDGTVRPLAFAQGVRSAEQLLAELGGD